jgi:hypothetical protein
VVSCPRTTSEAARRSQQLFVQAAQATAETQAVVTSFLQGDERASDPNQSHTDSFPAPSRPVTILAGAARRPVRAARSGTLRSARGPG